MIFIDILLKITDSKAVYDMSHTVYQMLHIRIMLLELLLLGILQLNISNVTQENHRIAYALHLARNHNIEYPATLAPQHDFALQTELLLTVGKGHGYASAIIKTLYRVLIFLADLMYNKVVRQLVPGMTLPENILQRLINLERFKAVILQIYIVFAQIRIREGIMKGLSLFQIMSGIHDSFYINKHTGNTARTAIYATNNLTYLMEPVVGAVSKAEAIFNVIFFLISLVMHCVEEAFQRCFPVFRMNSI